MVHTRKKVVHPDYNVSDFRQMFPDVLVYAEGVYVDISYRDGEMVLGFVVIEAGKTTKFSRPSACNQTAAAEEQAIQIAQKMFPGKTVYSDHIESAKRTGATYIPREKNKLAHNTAKFRYNFEYPEYGQVDWADFEKEVAALGFRADQVTPGHWQVRRSLASPRVLNWWPFSKNQSVQVTELNYSERHCDLERTLQLIESLL